MAGSSSRPRWRWLRTTAAVVMVAGMAGSCTGDDSKSARPGPSSTSSSTPAGSTTTAPGVAGPEILSQGSSSPYPAVADGAVQLRLEGLSEGQQVQADLDAAGERVTVAATGAVRACWDGRCVDVAGQGRDLEASGAILLTVPGGSPGVVSLTYVPRSRNLDLTLDVVADRTLRLALVPARDQDFAARATWGSAGRSVEMTLDVLPGPPAPQSQTVEAGMVSGGPPLELSHSSSPPAQPVLTVRARDGGTVEDLRLVLTWP